MRKHKGSHEVGSRGGREVRAAQGKNAGAGGPGGVSRHGIDGGRGGAKSNGRYSAYYPEKTLPEEHPIHFDGVPAGANVEGTEADPAEVGFVRRSGSLMAALRESGEQANSYGAEGDPLMSYADRVSGDAQGEGVGVGPARVSKKARGY